MMKKMILTSVCAMLSFGAFAEMPMDMMANLTEEQKACVETHGCVKPEQPEMTEAQNTFMDCMKNAMTSCGIQMPEPPAPEAPVMDIPAPEAPVMDIPAPEVPVMDIPAPESAPQE